MTLMAAYKALFANINPAETTLITPNRRLAQTLHHLFHELQIEKGLNAWLTPDILPYSTWLERLWLLQTADSKQSPPLLLNNTQIEALFEKIVLSSIQEHPLLQVTETADMVKKAASLIKQWQVDIHHPLFDSQGDYQFFKKWFQQFENICNEKNWITTAHLENLIFEYLIQKKIFPPKEIILLGFTEFSPALKNIISACTQRGVKITSIETDSVTKNNAVLTFKEADDEVTSLALWAKKIHLSHPEKRIGCVIPTLTQNRDRIEQVFREIFATHLSSFNISAGKAILEYPLIHHAIQLLAMHPDKISYEQLKLFLNTPFIGEADKEHFKRGQVEIALREKNITSIDVNHLAQNLSSAHFLLTRLQKFFAALNTHEENSFRYFAEHFNDLLSILGWPGEKTLVSHEYQMIEQWLQLLEQLSSLDYIFEKTTYKNALYTLKKMARNHIFQPKTPEAPVQVLGLLEAAGAPFDELWVSGMNDRTWPPKPEPNPFIPKQIQRELGMPHSSAERELRYCIKLTEQFQQAAEHLIFSYAEKMDDLETGISPILNDIPRSSLDFPTHINKTQQIFALRQTEILQDELAPKLAHEGHVAGGSDVIKQQALCPFKAFAKHRLHLREVDDTTIGLRAKERGIVIHNAMQIIWQALVSHTNLLTLSNDALNECIYYALQSAFEKIENQHPSQKNLLSLEKERLQNVIFAWLEVEKKRDPFTIHALEEKMLLTIDNVTFDIRIDRIDKLANDQLVILDYKTGKGNSIQHFFGERPDDPQLPLYAIMDEKHTAAIAYAEINAKDPKFIGLSAIETNIPGIKPFAKLSHHDISSWSNQLTYWQQTFSKLCHDYLQGIASISPKKPNETCTQCHLQPLCRINEEI